MRRARCFQRAGGGRGRGGASAWRRCVRASVGTPPPARRPRHIAFSPHSAQGPGVPWPPRGAPPDGRALPCAPRLAPGSAPQRLADQSPAPPMTAQASAEALPSAEVAAKSIWVRHPRARQAPASSARRSPARRVGRSAGGVGGRGDGRAAMGGGRRRRQQRRGRRVLLPPPPTSRRWATCSRGWTSPSFSTCLWARGSWCVGECVCVRVGSAARGPCPRACAPPSPHAAPRPPPPPTPQISVKLIRNRSTGASEGYAFLEFRTHETADNILKSFNGQPIPGTDQVGGWVEGGGALPRLAALCMHNSGIHPSSFTPTPPPTRSRRSSA